MPADKPLLYVFLGATGSGRREILADLLEVGLAPDPGARSAVLLPEGEPPSAFDARLGPTAAWRRLDGAIAAEVPAGATHVFFVADGRSNPVDQLEALKPWLDSAGLELARIVCVVHCRLAETHPPLLVWYDACIHFSDMVLLHQRDGVSNKWISDFRARYESRFFPCLFELVKGGRVKNPALLLEPQARRISHYFDEGLEWAVEEDEDEGGDVALEGEEAAGGAEVDPYLERRAGGRRARELPDIADFLESDSPRAR